MLALRDPTGVTLSGVGVGGVLILGFPRDPRVPFTPEQ